MKITKTQDTTFNPVTLTITFETKEELETFRSCVGYNVTIPDSLKEAGVSAETAATFCKQLFDLFYALADK